MRLEGVITQTSVNHSITNNRLRDLTYMQTAAWLHFGSIDRIRPPKSNLRGNSIRIRYHQDSNRIFLVLSEDIIENAY
jgi:hypothetical protein